MYEYAGAAALLYKLVSVMWCQERQVGHQTIHINPMQWDFSGNGSGVTLTPLQVETCLIGLFWAILSILDTFSSTWVWAHTTPANLIVIAQETVKLV